MAGGPNHAFRTGANLPIRATDDLGLLGGLASSSYVINNSGQLAGDVQPSSGSDRAVLVKADRTYLNLGDMGGFFPSSVANGLNDLGQVTGASGPASGCGFSHAFVSQPNSVLTPSSDLGSLRACGNSDGHAVNNLGRVVGNTDVAVGVTHAMFWSSGSGMVDLGVLGVTSTISSFFGNASNASAINNAGQIVGNSSFANMPGLSYTHAFITTSSGPMQDLGTLGGNGASASSINNLGQVVGSALLTGDSALHGFIYTNGIMTDLNSLITATGWEIISGTQINDNWSDPRLRPPDHRFAVRLQPLRALGPSRFRRQRALKPAVRSDARPRRWSGREFGN